jgi:hypothetical protein
MIPFYPLSSGKLRFLLFAAKCKLTRNGSYVTKLTLLRHCSLDSTHGSEIKKSPKVSKATANHVMTDQATSDMNGNDTDIPRSVSPMEVDCKGVTRNEQMDTDGVLPNAPLSEDSEYFEEAFKKLQDFVCEKLQRTVLSFKEFKRLLLLKQTGWSRWDSVKGGVTPSHHTHYHHTHYHHTHYHHSHHIHSYHTHSKHTHSHHTHSYHTHHTHSKHTHHTHHTHSKHTLRSMWCTYLVLTQGL